jgi:MYXO-CTERM domain-containing protein
VFIEKSAEFTQGPIGGVFPSIDILFTQINPIAVHNIVIDDEIVTNHTGVAWTDFHMDLLGNPAVSYDVAATATSGGPPPIGFNIGPYFTTASFAAGNTQLNIAGGVLPNGAVWFPGGGASDGQLWMHIATLQVGQSYTLREQPTPAPGALALLGMATLLGASRRRRA